MSSMALSHRKHADTLILAVVNPLNAYLAKYRRLLELKRSEVNSNNMFLQKALAEVVWRRNAYLKASDSADPEAGSLKREYIGAVNDAEHARSALECHITEFLNFAQEAEFLRLQVSKEAFLAMESAQLFTMQHQAQLWSPEGSETTKLATPDPVRGVVSTIDKFATGTARTAPIVLPLSEMPLVQAFGVSLEELERWTNDPIPSIVRKCVAALFEGMVKRKIKSGVDAWLYPNNSEIPAIQFLRMEANGTCGGSGVHYSRVQRENPVIVAGVLKLFMLELPASLVTPDIYDTLKIVYNASLFDSAVIPEDEEIRLKTVSSLLMTLPPAHYETLKLFAGLLHNALPHPPKTRNNRKSTRYPSCTLYCRPPHTLPQYFWRTLTCVLL
ncbi:Rho GTPase activation protein [Chytriomyces sp. MP71]|nr:Rho GTPase activation protein [Chytriomyces sp. MP71]